MSHTGTLTHIKTYLGPGNLLKYPWYGAGQTQLRSKALSPSESGVGNLGNSGNPSHRSVIQWKFMPVQGENGSLGSP